MDAAINTNQTLCTMNMHAKLYGCAYANNSALFLLIQSLKLPSLKVFLEAFHFGPWAPRVDWNMPHGARTPSQGPCQPMLELDGTSCLGRTGSVVANSLSCP